MTIGVAAAGALGARDKADRLGAARGAAVSGDTELVTKAAVTAAEAEAEQKVIELGLVVSPVRWLWARRRQPQRLMPAS